MLYLRRRAYVQYGSVSDTKVQSLCAPCFDVMTLIRSKCARRMILAEPMASVALMPRLEVANEMNQKAAA
jgi:hypothetical protein